jgi:hypothetical protein
MATYYHQCTNCNKKIRKKPDFIGKIICLDCRKKQKIKTCEYCGSQFYPRKSVNRYCSTSCSSKHNLTGRKLTKQHKENLSKAAWNNKGNGYAKVRFYKVWCPYLGKEVSVQGTYELKYSQYLNEQNILWNRGKHISLQYNRFDGDILRNYYPDFYLPNSDEYIEVKGYFGEIDKIKMNLVVTQNPKIKLQILQFEDLVLLGCFDL